MLYRFLALYCSVMLFFDYLWDFSAIFALNFVKLDPWDWHKRISDYIFPVSPRRVLGLSYAHLKFSKEKKVVMATSPKPFDEIP